MNTEGRRRMTADQPQEVQENKNYDFQVALAIIGAGLTNAITLLQINGPLTFWNTIVGIIILCILWAYIPAPTSRRSLNFAYAATWSITFLTTFGVVFNIVFAFFFGSDAFPDSSADCFTPFPISKNARFPHCTAIFTPFNVYDISFFLMWIAIFIIFLLVFSHVRNKEGNGTSSPQKEMPQTEANLLKNILSLLFIWIVIFIIFISHMRNKEGNGATSW
jgi:hypothetical protein